MKKRSKIIITVLVSLVIAEALAFSMIATYRKGHENGYTEGAKISTTDVDSRIKSGYDRGYAEGKNAGYSSGYTEGKNDGYDSGKTDGYSSGYTDGENAGYNSGYISGYRAGVSAGKSQVSTYQPSTSQPTTNRSSARTCLSAGCDRPRFSNICFYCEHHKCAMPSCNSGASYNSFYCLIHD